MLGATLGGVLTDRFGRRKLIIMAGIIFTASAVGTALASKLKRTGGPASRHASHEAAGCDR